MFQSQQTCLSNWCKMYTKSAQYYALFSLVLGLILIDKRVEPCIPNKFDSRPSGSASPASSSSGITFNSTSVIRFGDTFAVIYQNPDRTMDRNDAKHYCMNQLDGRSMSLASIQTEDEKNQLRRTLRVNKETMLNFKFWTSAKQSASSPSGFIWSDTNANVDYAAANTFVRGQGIPESEACGVFYVNENGHSTLEGRRCDEKSFAALCRQ